MSNLRIFGLLLGAAFWFSLFSANAATIDFDNFAAPGSFTGSALTNEYTYLGANFSGSGEVVNFLSNYDGVPLTSPFSSPNFLAFNSEAGVFPSETILFDYNINYFDLDFAGTSELATITAYLGGTQVGQTSMSTIYGEWNGLSLSGMVFDRVVFDVADSAGAFVIDNLNFTAAVPVPAAIWLFISGLAGLFGIRKLK